jgi:hypothetical protein
MEKYLALMGLALWCVVSVFLIMTIVGIFIVFWSPWQSISERLLVVLRR